MSRLYSIFGFALLAVVAAPGQPLQAQVARIQPAIVYPGGNYDALKEALNLSDSQVRQLQDLQRSRQVATQTAYQEINDKQKEFTLLLNSGSADAARLGQLQIEMANLRKQVSSQTSLRDQALQILDSGQRAKLTDLENAMKLQRAASEALGLGLIDPPQMQVMHSEVFGN